MATKLSNIKINSDNPRFIKDDKFKKLVASVSDFPKMMELRPIVVDSEMVILGGNMRYRALQELGYTEIDDSWVKVADKLTEEEKKRFIIEDNMPFGEWDWDILANQFEVGDLLDWGFSENELKIEQEVVEDEVPEVSDEPAISKLGEVYQLGRHRIMCGDSTKIEDVEKLMDGKKADMVFTDPPYAVNYGADQDLLNKKSGNKFRLIAKPIIGDGLSTEECAEQIWRPAFRNLYESAKDDCSFYMTMCQGGDQMMMMMMMSENWQIKHELIWVKSSPVFSMGRLDYDYQHEPILFGWKKKHNWYGGGQFLKSIWTIDKPSKSELHPTMKPIELIVNAIKNSSKQDDIVLDLFGGSGSTLIACEQTNRICYGMEIDPKYCDVIRKRYAKFIGKEEEWQTI